VRNALHGKQLDHPRAVSIHNIKVRTTKGTYRSDIRYGMRTYCPYIFCLRHVWVFSDARSNMIWDLRF
jgi:uncharacterized membrane protein (GlpM family)